MSKVTSKDSPGEASRGNNAVSTATSEQSSRREIRDGRRVKREEFGRKSNSPDNLEIISQEKLIHDAEKSLAEVIVSRHSQSLERKNRQWGNNVREVQVKTLSEY